MKNLQKYTKSELISKYQKLESNLSKNENSLYNKIKKYFLEVWDLILNFKNLLLKLTLFSFIIQILKNFKLFRGLWMIANSIIISIFGISLLDNGLLNFFNDLFLEAKFIFASAINYLSNTSFYKFLGKLFGNDPEIESKDAIKQVKREIVKEARKEIIEEIHNNPLLSSKSQNERNEFWNDTNNRSINRNTKEVARLKDWLNPKAEEIIVEETGTNYNKYIIGVAIIISASLCYHYSEEIKTGAVSLLEWLMSFRTRPGVGGGDGSNNTTPTGPAIQIDPPNDIDHYFPKSEKGKAPATVLTSPSLENLNERVVERWSEGSGIASTSGVSTPESSSSDITVTPESLKINTNVESSTSSIISSISSSTAKFIGQNWKGRLSDNAKSNINFIETFTRSTDFEATSPESLDAIHRLTDLIFEYNKDCATYEFMKNDKAKFGETSEGLKIALHHFRCWIKEYHAKLVPDAVNMLIVPENIGSPVEIAREIYE